MRSISSIRIIRMTLALAVALWMAGAGCMLGCENMVSAATSTGVASHETTPILVASAEACASMQSHHCCAKRGAGSAAKTTPKASINETATFVSSATAVPGTMMDCPLAVNAAAALSKAGSDQSIVALPAATERISLSDSHEHAVAFARPLRLPNRGHTYLRLCVFLN